ncbi:hypothetical protein K2224_21340 [Streptomyces sp. BHT-5-2]|uniref:hypothetical protein n=1 Tax=Streptomyces sp. BHT-5-2 TaxID=2866715 RepID=UPI001C8D449D|nr:hypothetical protein [Streptomyces sp. BHT-5-2]QZL07131.1 hypothetical protein K2224_21340 [Streptomyces sp. BHT-5-2]
MDHQLRAQRRSSAPCDAAEPPRHLPEARPGTPDRPDWWGNLTFAAGLVAVPCPAGITYGIQPCAGHTGGGLDQPRGVGRGPSPPAGWSWPPPRRGPTPPPRRPGPAARRASLISLNDAGQALLDAVRQETAGVLAEGLGRLAPARRRLLARAPPALEELAEALGQRPAPGPNGRGGPPGRRPGNGRR